MTASSNNDNNTPLVWEARTGLEIARLEGHENWVNKVSFSPDGHLIVTAARDNTARVWDALTGKENLCLEGHEDWVNNVSFSPDGHLILTASDDNTVRIWDARRGQEIACLEGHEDKVNIATFSPDERIIVTASRDKTVRVWDVSRAGAIAGNRAVSLIATLANGIGRRTKAESIDLLMQDAAEDLFTEALKKFEELDPERAAKVDDVAVELRAPLHPNCYLSPTEFAKKFGIENPKSKARNPNESTSETDAPTASDQKLIYSPVSLAAPGRCATLRWRGFEFRG